jgi:hypothetical protein
MASSRDAATSSAPDDLVRLSHDIADAIRRRDRPLLDAVLDADFVQIDEHGNRLSKAAFVHAIEASEFDIDTISFEMLSVEPFHDAAIVCGVQHAAVRLPSGDRVEGRTAFTDVFVRLDGRWRLRVATSAELANPDASSPDPQAGPR